MTTALGVSCDLQNNGVTPLAHRLIIGSLFQNTGVVKGMTVSGRSDLRYQVSAGLAVTQRAASDGKMLAYWTGGQTETAVSAGDPTHPRIDVVWVKANNKPEYTSDDDNQVHVGVTQGTPAAAPVKPQIPAGCTELRAMLMPAGATSTQSATVYSSILFALPYGASLGLLGENWNKNNSEWGAAINTAYVGQQVQFTVPTDRWVQFDFKVNFSALDKEYSEWGMGFQLDGTILDHSSVNFAVSGSAWETHETSYTAQVEAGTHTASVVGRWNKGSTPRFHYSAETGLPLDGRIGRRFQLWDRGPAQ